jgi:lysine biosynthesis protein LysW
MAKAYCPNCDSVISSDKPRMGAVITCGECGQELEIISVSPFEVDFPLADDWDDEYEEDEE